MQNVGFCYPSNAFSIILHGDFTDFRERVAQKLLYAVVYWSFSSTFLDIRVKMPKIPTYPLSYLMLFELRWSSSPHAQNIHICCRFKSFFGYKIPIFPCQNPMKTCTKWKVFGPGPHLGPKRRQGAPEYQENDSKTKHSEPPIFHFSRKSCGKPT